MENKVVSRALLLTGVALLASCGVDRISTSSSNIGEVPSSSSSVAKEPDDYLNDYRLALKYGSIQQDFSTSVQGGPISFGFEILEPKKLIAPSWEDFHLDGESFALSSAVNGFGRGKDKMKASFHVPETILKVSGTKLPSFIGDNAKFTLNADAYLDKGVVYADLSKQSLFNYVLQIAIRNLTGDKAFELVDQGHHEFTSSQWEKFQGLCLYSSTVDPVDRFFAAAYKKLPNTISFGEINGLSKMTVRIDNKADLETLAVHSVESFYQEFGPLLDSLSFSNVVFPKLPDISVAVAKVREALKAVDFTSYLKSVVYDREKGVLSESFALDIASFDHDLMYELFYGKNGIAPLDPTKEQTLLLPAGRLKVHYDLTRKYGARNVKADVLTDEEKALFQTPITFPVLPKTA